MNGHSKEHLEEFSNLMKSYNLKYLFKMFKYTIIVDYTFDKFEAIFWPDFKNTLVQTMHDRRFLRAFQVKFNLNEGCHIWEWLYWGDVDSDEMPLNARSQLQDYWIFVSYYDLGKNFIPVGGGDDDKYRRSNMVDRPFVTFKGKGADGNTFEFKQYNHSPYDKFKKLGIASEGGFKNRHRVVLERLSLFIDQRIFQNLYGASIHPNVFNLASLYNFPYKALDPKLVLNSSLIQHLRELREDGQFGLCLGLIEKLNDKDDKETAKALVFG